MFDYREARTGRHCVLALHAYRGFITNYRHPVFIGRHPARLEKIMRDACSALGREMREFNGEDQHVHLLAGFPSKVAISRLVNPLKGVPSRRMRPEFPGLRRHYRRAKRLCSVPASPGRPAARPCLSCASTSSSRTGRLDPG